MKETVSALLDVFPWIVPECVLGFFACVLFLGTTWRRSRRLWGAVALVGLAGSAVALFWTSAPTVENEQAAIFAGPLWLDQIAILIKWIAIVGGIILVLFTWEEMPEDQAGEYHGCLLIIIAGVGFTAMANDLVMLFLSLELVSIPTYVLLYLPRQDKAAQEAGVKYFLLSVFSSALLLFGFSYLYGVAGTTNLHGVADALNNPGAMAGKAVPGLALVAVVMVVAGLGFKITAVPFHFYAPDVYQGTSTGGAALLAFIPKVAGFIALIRVLNLLPFELIALRKPEIVGPIAPLQVSTLLWIVAAVTMTLGNVLAILQDNVKRLLAYSSVAHAGYMLIGLTIAPYLVWADVPVSLRAAGIVAILFYLVSYGAMTIGAFGILSYLSKPGRSVETVDDLAGLSRSHPGIALLMALFMFSLIGLPATAGFVGKFLLFIGAFSVPFNPDIASEVEQARLFRILAVIAVINAAIGGWYYLRIVAVMYLRNPLQPLDKGKVSPGLASVWLCAAITLGFGLYPRPLIDQAHKAVADIPPMKKTVQTSQGTPPQE